MPGPVNTETGNHLQAGIPPRFMTSHSGQLSLLPSVGWKNDAGQSAVTLCGWGVKAGRFIPLWINVWLAGKTVRSLVNTCHTWVP